MIKASKTDKYGTCKEKDKSLIKDSNLTKKKTITMTVKTHQNWIEDTKRQPEPMREMVLSKQN